MKKASHPERQKFLEGAREVYESISEIEQAGFKPEQAMRAMAAINQGRLDELEAVARTLAGSPLYPELKRALKRYRKDSRDLYRALTTIVKADKAAATLGIKLLPSTLLHQHHEERQGGSTGGVNSAKVKRTMNAERDKAINAKWDEYDRKNTPERDRIGKMLLLTWPWPGRKGKKRRVPRSTMVGILKGSGRYKPMKKK